MHRKEVAAAAVSPRSFVSGNSLAYETLSELLTPEQMKQIVTAAAAQRDFIFFLTFLRLLLHHEDGFWRRRVSAAQVDGGRIVHSLLFLFLLFLGVLLGNLLLFLLVLAAFVSLALLKVKR